MSDRKLALELFKEIVKNKSVDAYVDAYFDILKEIEETQTETFKGRLQEIYDNFEFHTHDGASVADYMDFRSKIEELLKGDKDE